MYVLGHVCMYSVGNHMIGTRQEKKGGGKQGAYLRERVN